MTHKIVTQLSFIFNRYIGSEGANSQTFLAYDPQLGAELVIKSIPKSSFEQHEEIFFKESKILYNNSHPNIMEINYACEDETKIYLSMPYLEKGSLNSLINSRFLTVREIIGYSLDFLSGLHYIHSRDLIHFDVKPTNILINDSNHAVITDFGLSEFSNSDGFATPEKIYGLHFVPEAFTTSALTSQFDIYQAGLTLYRMCNGNEDFKSQSIGLTQNKIEEGEFPSRDTFLPHIPNGLKKCIKKALQVDQDKRYTTIVEMMNDLSAVDEMLDWTYSRKGDNEEWVLENEKTSKMICLNFVRNFWSIEGYNINKNTQRKTKITKCFSEFQKKADAHKKINLLLKEI